MADKAEPDAPVAPEEAVEIRRAALKKMGRYAAYTAPALLASNKAHAGS